MSSPAENSEQGPAVPPTPEGLLSFLRDNPHTHPEGWESPLPSFYDMYPIDVPEHRVPDVGLDAMTIFLIRKPEEQALLPAEPDHVLAAISTWALEAFQPIELPSMLAEWYYVVTTAEASKLALVKAVGPKVSETDANSARPPEPSTSRSLLGRLGLQTRRESRTADSRSRVVMGFPVAEADSLEVGEILNLLQEGIREPRPWRKRYQT